MVVGVAIVGLSGCGQLIAPRSDPTDGSASLSADALARVARCATRLAQAYGTPSRTVVFRTDVQTVSSKLSVSLDRPGTQQIYLVWLSGHFRDDRASASDAATHVWQALPVDSDDEPCPNGDSGAVTNGSSIDVDALGASTDVQLSGEREADPDSVAVLP